MRFKLNEPVKVVAPARPDTQQYKGSVGCIIGRGVGKDRQDYLVRLVRNNITDARLFYKPELQAIKIKE